MVAGLLDLIEQGCGSPSEIVFLPSERRLSVADLWELSASCAAAIASRTDSQVPVAMLLDSSPESLGGCRGLRSVVLGLGGGGGSGWRVWLYGPSGFVPVVVGIGPVLSHRLRA
jgi:hypothetical protein